MKTHLFRPQTTSCFYSVALEAVFLFDEYDVLACFLQFMGFIVVVQCTYCKSLWRKVNKS